MLATIICYIRRYVTYNLSHTKLMLCFTNYLPSEGDLAGWEDKNYEMICITKTTMIAKYLEETSVHS